MELLKLAHFLKEVTNQLCAVSEGYTFKRVKISPLNGQNVLTASHP